MKEKISCEIILTDTGSTNKTVGIAEKYADKVLNFKWNDNFSDARNTGVEASCGKWFVFIDADEILDDSVAKIFNFTMFSSAYVYTYNNQQSYKNLIILLKILIWN